MNNEELDKRPRGCRFRLQDEGKPYPRSSCVACGRGIRTLGRKCQEAPDDDANIGTYDKTTHVVVPVELLHEARLALTGTLPGTCTHHDRNRMVKESLAAILAAQENSNE